MLQSSTVYVKILMRAALNHYFTFEIPLGHSSGSSFLNPHGWPQVIPESKFATGPTVSAVSDDKTPAPLGDLSIRGRPAETKDVLL